MLRAEDRTVLVVDDEPNVRDYLAQILRDAGFRVVTAGDGGEALEKIRAAPPDFISLDLVMPKKSGHRLLLELRRDRELARIPVLVVTAHAHDELGQGDCKTSCGTGWSAGRRPCWKSRSGRSTTCAACSAPEIARAREGDESAQLEQALKQQSAVAGPQALRRHWKRSAGAVREPPEAANSREQAMTAGAAARRSSSWTMRPP
jgi:CheY-like chemotaxis protein